MPYETAGNPIKPFYRGQITLSEEITYLFRDPKVGDRVNFERNDFGTMMLGVITKINEEGNVRKYTIQSSMKCWILKKKKSDIT